VGCVCGGVLDFWGNFLSFSGDLICIVGMLVYWLIYFLMKLKKFCFFLLILTIQLILWNMMNDKDDDESRFIGF
jgi:hypothetical protein